MVFVQITPECAVLVPREGDDSSSTGDSSDSRCPTSAQSGVVHSTRPVSAPLPSLSDRYDTNDVSRPGLQSTLLIFWQ